ncbi:hypothetical protein PENTCL1PPCAC_6077, partial [Pristionchus entomophagus]
IKMGDVGCNVCHDEFSATVDRRVPRVLSACGHTICTGCATGIHRVGSRNLVCPFDRVPTALPDDRIASLKKNFALLEVLERLASKKREDGEEGDRFANDRLLGVECDEDSRHVAVLYCTVCDSSLCERCSEASHSSSNVLSRHRRVPLSEKPKPAPTCSQHSTYKLEFVCIESDCDAKSRLMCLLCRDYGDHKDHMHAFLDKEAEELRTTVEKALEDLRRAETGLDSWLNSVQNTVMSLSDRTDGPLQTARNDVKEHFRLLREKLERDEGSALDKLEGYIEDRLDDLNNQQRNYISQSGKIASACSELSKCAKKDNPNIVEGKEEIQTLVELAKAEKVEAPAESSLSLLIPFHIGTDNRLHIGHFLDARVVFLGIDGSGKTTLVAKLKKTDPLLGHAPTIGFNVETVHHRNFRLNIWDVGGLPKLRPCWRHYYMHTQAVIFVLDGACEERYEEALNEFHSVSSQVACPLVVVINRRRGETPTPANLDSLVASLERATRPVHVHHVDASRGVGLKAMLDDLTTMLACGVH